MKVYVRNTFLTLEGEVDDTFDGCSGIRPRSAPPAWREGSAEERSTMDQLALTAVSSVACVARQLAELNRRFAEAAPARFAKVVSAASAAAATGRCKRRAGRSRAPAPRDSGVEGAPGVDHGGAAQTILSGIYARVASMGRTVEQTVNVFPHKSETQCVGPSDDFKRVSSTDSVSTTASDRRSAAMSRVGSDESVSSCSSQGADGNLEALCAEWRVDEGKAYSDAFEKEYVELRDIRAEMKAISDLALGKKQEVQEVKERLARRQAEAEAPVSEKCDTGDREHKLLRRLQQAKLSYQKLLDQHRALKSQAQEVEGRMQECERALSNAFDNWHEQRKLQEESASKQVEATTIEATLIVEDTRRQLPSEYRHSRVPKTVDIEKIYANTSAQAPTTLMIRNVPNRYTQQDLITELNGLGFAGTFNFLYLPLDKGTMRTVGYGFVNFTQHDTAMRFLREFQGHVFLHPRKAVSKPAAVSVAHIQGLDANVRHYENAAVSHARTRHHRPVIMAMASLANELSETQSIENSCGG